MTLDKLQNDMIQAMKDKDSIRKNVLSGVIGAVKNAAIAKKCKDNITEELVNEVLLKEKKTLQEQIDTCPAQRIENKKEFLNKMKVLEEYCPKLLEDSSEIEAIIKQLCEDSNCDLTKNNRGSVMKIVMSYFKGKADMKVVNETLQRLLV